MASPDPAALMVTAAPPAVLPGLADLMADSPLLQRYGLSRDAAVAALERAWRADDLILAARRGGGPPVGLAWVIRSRVLTGAAYLRLLLVAEGQQGGGVGGRLLAAAEADARDRANHLFLLVTADNLRARRFYERRGYRSVGSLPEFAVPEIDEVLYHKPLRTHGERLPV